MADDIKDRDNKDAEESGRPVQLDPEEQGGKTGEHDEDKQHDERGMEHGQKHGQTQQGQNR